MLEHNGQKLFQSGAIMRYLGQMGDGTLYPKDQDARYTVNRAVETIKDFEGAWRFPFYTGMKPENFGHYDLTNEAKENLKNT